MKVPSSFRVLFVPTSVILLLIVLLTFHHAASPLVPENRRLVKDEDANEGDAPRQPFSFHVSGGGFRTLLVGMAFARAMSEAFESSSTGKNWEDVTHLGSNSGGSWFMVQFAYGQTLFDELTKPRIARDTILGIFDINYGYKSLTDILTEWGRNYEQNANDLPLDDDPVPVSNSDIECSVFGLDAAPLAGLVLDLLDSVGFGFSPLGFDAQSLANEILRPVVPNIDTLTYADPLTTLPNAALIQQLALPPDAWVEDPQSGQKQQVYCPLSYNLTYPNGPIVLPFAHVHSAQNARGNAIDGFYTPAFGQATTFLPLRSASDGDAETVNMMFPPKSRTKVSEVTAVSSAATGGFGSPTMTRALFNLLFSLLSGNDEQLDDFDKIKMDPRTAKVLEDVLREAKQVGRDISDVIDDFVSCLPGIFDGIEGLSPSLMLEPAPGSAQPPWTPSYHFLDGGYVENTAIHMTLATFIHSCEYGDTSLNCTDKTIDVAVLDDGLIHAHATPCFFDHSRIDDVCKPSGETQTRHLVLEIPSLQIFAERFPTEWTIYAPRRGWTPEYLPDWVKFQSYISYIQDNFDGSRYTSGTFTTVDNQAYGIKSGYKVRLLLFEMNLPVSLNPISVSPDGAENMISTFFTADAEAQAEGMKPVIEKWLRHEI